MRCMTITAAAMVAVALTMGQSAQALNLLAPGDFIISVNVDQKSSVGTGGQSYPGGEPPANAIDGTLNKYLNFRKENTGIIVTPDAASIVKSMVITTANDAEERDPASYALYGTNDVISSGNNSAGWGETWTLISEGPLTLPKGVGSRNQVGAPVDIVNSDSYTSYRLVFPTLFNGPATNSMQIAEVQFYDDAGGAGNAILAPTNPVLSVLPSTYPANEGPANLLDGDTGTKFLSFGKENTGVIVTPAIGPSVLRHFSFNLANDSEGFSGRDPVEFEIYGTNDPITSPNDSPGDAETWTLLNSGTLDYAPENFGLVGPIPVGATDYYTSYKVVFPTIRDSATANSLQISELQFIGSIPEPSTYALLTLGLVAAGLGRRAARRRAA